MTDFADTANRVIVVEDDSAVRNLLRLQLAAAGYDVAAYEDGRAAFEAISRDGAGIVVADWAMPGMDGLELCAALYELADMQAIGTFYFILLTAHDSKEDVVRGLEGGAHDYLTKPYHPGELIARLHVGKRVLALQDELVRRQLEVHKAHLELAGATRKLEQLANTDGLTGLMNRRSLFDRGSEAWSMAERAQHPLSCVMIDIDRFKKINDTHGHKAGDIALKETAALVQRAARRYDLCARLGGEEFVIISPCNGLDGTTALAERIRRSIELATVIADGVHIPITVSLGVAERAGSDASIEALLSRADAMLYAAKENGRNQVWVAGPQGGARAGAPVSEPVLSA